MTSGWHEHAARDLLQKLETLSRQPVSPEEYYRGYLDALMQLPGARGAHLWLLQGRDFVPLGGSDRAEILYDSDEGQRHFMLSAIEKCANGQHSVMEQGANGVQPGDNKCPYDLAFTPLLHGKGGGAVQGVQVSWWNRGAAKNGSEFTGLLELCAPYAARTMRAQKLESMSQLSGQLQLMSHFLTELAGAQDLEAVASTVANRARETLACDRCSLLVAKPGGELKVAAISNVPTADARSTMARTMVQIVEHARKGTMPALFRKANEKTEEKGDLSDYFYHSKMQEVLVLPLQPPGSEMVGAILFESEGAGFFDQNKATMASSVAAQACVPVRTLLLKEQMPLQKWMEEIAVWRRRPVHEKKDWLRKRLWIPAAILLAIMLFPVRMQLTGTAKVLPRERALAVAETQGRVARVLAAEGAQVKKGDALLELDDTELRKRVEIARKEESRLQAEADRLLLQNERAAAQVAQLALERAEREREYHEGQMKLATIRSPLDGVVMTPDLRSRQGDAVQPGSQLAMIGDPVSWDLEVNLPESDVALLLERVERNGPVPVRFKLASLPQRTFHAELAESASVASAAEVIDGKNTFRVLVPLPANEDYGQYFRAGYTGRARFDVGYRPLFYSAMRRFFNWLRTSVLF